MRRVLEDARFGRCFKYSYFIYDALAEVKDGCKIGIEEIRENFTFFMSCY